MMSWREEDYADYLRGERKRYAWTLVTYGGYEQELADDLARTRYPYEPPTAAYRGLAFSRQAWTWAMLHLHGDFFWERHPDLAGPPAEYRRID